MHGIDLKLLTKIITTHRPSWGSTKWFEPLLSSALASAEHYVRDAHGNYFVLIGNSEQSDVAFTSHLIQWLGPAVLRRTLQLLIRASCSCATHKQRIV